MISDDIQLVLGVLSALYIIIEVVAITTAVIAVRETRTPQGAIAWFLSLIAFPLVSLPLYWVFGRNKFNGYVEAMREGEERFQELIGEKTIPAIKPLAQRNDPCLNRYAFEALAGLPFASGNKVDLLVDGKDTFGAIFEAIKAAKKYILVQFYIVHDDELGQRFKALLEQKAREGVRIHFLYDELGCNGTPSSYWEKMQESGVQVNSFHTTKGRGNRFQLNFRNHRKIVVVDGHTAFVGGHNVGDEYLGISKEFDGWRDTHVRITGPAVLGVRISFAKDWYWATGELYEIDFDFPAEAGNANTLIMATGPADEMEPCSLMFIRAINASRKRFWIASPYFVPDLAVTKALQLAAMRGVDVRILLPEKADHLLVYLAGFACLKDLFMPNIHVYRYTKGFLHQKVFLSDDFGAVGTANLDNRSFRLNFEITAIVEDEKFCTELEQMFLDDFANSIEAEKNEYYEKNVVYQTIIKFARLLSPIL